MTPELLKCTLWFIFQKDNQVNTRSKAEKRNYHVPNLDRALQIIERLSSSARGMNRNEIAAATGCTPTMVYRIMMTFADAGWVYRDEATGAYRLSRRLLDFAVAGTDEYSLAAAAWPEMCQLRDETNITVQLGILTDDGAGILLETAESRSPIRFVAEKGVRVTDLHAGAGWKSILAFLPAAECARCLDRLSYRRLTATTITTRAALEKAFAHVRATGYAVDDSEMIEGLHCVAAPIFNRAGHPVGTLTLSAPADQLPRADFKRRAASVMAAAAAVSAKLGWKGKV